MGHTQIAHTGQQFYRQIGVEIFPNIAFHFIKRILLVGRQLVGFALLFQCVDEHVQESVNAASSQKSVLRIMGCVDGLDLSQLIDQIGYGDRMGTGGNVLQKGLHHGVGVVHVDEITTKREGAGAGLAGFGENYCSGFQFISNPVNAGVAGAIGGEQFHNIAVPDFRGGGVAAGKGHGGVKCTVSYNIDIGTMHRHFPLW